MAFASKRLYSHLMLIKSVLGMVFIAMLVWWTFAPSAGEREFRRSQEALKHVNSWREEVSPGSLFQEEMEVSCTNQSAHLIRHSRPGSNGIAVMDDEARIGLSAYTRHSVRYDQTPANDITSDWQRGAYILPTVPCTALSRGGAAYSPDYERLIHTALITPGDKDYIHGAVCRDWKAHVMKGGYQGPRAEDDAICIGVDDHLPYRVRKGSITYILYDWNVPVAVDEPTVIERPRPSWQQAWPAGPSYDNTWAQREPEPPIHYLSPIPPPLPPPPVPPPPPGEEDEDPK